MAYKNTPNMVCMHMKSEMTHVSRNRGIDVVRVLMTLLVIFHHAAIGYRGSGGWFWREQPNASSSLLVMFNAINQSYFMGVFFLLAGYYTPKSYVRKGMAKFLMDRLLRLGLPLLTFFFILYPFTVAIAQAGQGRPLIKLWWDLIIAGKFGPGPLWFAIALLIFAMCYAIWQTCRRRAGWSAVSVDALPAMPALALIALGLGLLSFIVRLVMPVGREFLWLQLGYFSCYAFFYIAGCAAARSGLLERITLRDAAGWLIVSILAISTLPLMLMIRGRLGGFEGGWNINAFYYAIWDPAVAFGVILGLLAVAQRWGRNSTQIVSRLGSTAFGAFILHPPVLVALSVLAMPWAAAPVLKFIVIGCAACVASFALSAAIKSLPGVSKIYLTDNLY